MAAADLAAWLVSPGEAGFAVAAAFVAGTMAGSFLNVVAHRVPRGDTVIYGRSRCPACGATIRARDNVPVLGWLWLRGRCHDCGAAISARYPLVEGVAGSLSALVAAAEVAAWTGTGDPWPHVVAWVGRTVLVLTLFCWGLLAAAGHRVSSKTVAVAVMVVAVAAACLPPLRPLAVVCACAPPDGWHESLAASIAGLLAGWLGGGVGRNDARVTAAVVGAAFGWQAALLAAVAGGVGRVGRPRGTAGYLAPMLVVVGWRAVAWGWERACTLLAPG